MADRNVQPLYGNGEFPLAPTPYHSRVSDHRVDFEGGTSNDRVKNYQFIGFRPGFALQASELNEIQEHFQMQLTLSISMMNNWITSGEGNHWAVYNQNSPSGVGGISSAGFPTSIGKGGGYDSTGNALHDDRYQITAPGWRGACPLYPFANPYPPDGGDPSPQGRLVEANYFVGGAGAYVRINFWSGWYLTEVRGDGTLNSPEVSGLKHWVYLDLDTDSTYSQRFSVDVPVGSDLDQDILVGLVTTSIYTGCCPENQGTELDPCDSTLADNAAGVPNSAACGASRYGVDFQSASMVEPNSAGEYPIERDQISLCLKVNPLQRTVRYMNNVLLFTW